MPVLLISGVDRKVMSTTERLGMSGGLTMLGILQKPILIEHLESKLAEVFEESVPIDAGELGAWARPVRELTAYFQPKAFLDGQGTWVVAGVEALVRWQHPKLGLVMPADFIDLAESKRLDWPTHRTGVGAERRPDAGLERSGSDPQVRGESAAVAGQ